MNSLGKPLSLGDLVRNYLLIGKSIPEQESLYKRYWIGVEEAVKENTSDFIRDYMQMVAQHDYKKSTDANTKELYREFKELFHGQDSASLMKRLEKAGNVYASILDPIHCSTGSSRIDRLLTDFHHIKATTAHSLILKALLMWKDGEVTEDALAQVLDVLRIFLLRRRTVKLTNAENKAFPLMTDKLQVFLKAQDPREATFEYLRRNSSRMRMPSNKEIEEVLKTDNFYSLGISKLLLALMEEKLTKFQIPLEDKNLQKEHIMPQSMNRVWEKELGEDAERIHDELTDNIGNITLIRHNQELGNKPFEFKKEIFENNSGLQIAKTMIIKNDHWGEEEILKRRDWMISLLLNEVMPVPEHMTFINRSKSRRPALNFQTMGLIGKTLESTYIPGLKVTVIDDRKVEYQGQEWSLSGLVRELKAKRGELNASGSYDGPAYWTYNGIPLLDLYNQSYPHDEESDDEAED